MINWLPDSIIDMAVGKNIFTLRWTWISPNVVELCLYIICHLSTLEIGWRETIAVHKIKATKRKARDCWVLGKPPDAACLIALRLFTEVLYENAKMKICTAVDGIHNTYLLCHGVLFHVYRRYPACTYLYIPTSEAGMGMTNIDRERRRSRMI